MFPDADAKDLSLVTVRTHDAACSITGYGIPYANDANRELEGIVNMNKPVTNGVTLRDLLARDEFTLVVSVPPSAMDQFLEKHLPAVFTYPYGDEHEYNLESYRSIVSRTKGKTQFRPAYAFNNLNSFLGVSVQAVVQDFLWLQDEADRMSRTRLPAYFVARMPQTSPPEYFVILPNMTHFRKRFDAAWRRFTRKEGFEVLLFGSQRQRSYPVKWQALLTDMISTLRGNI